VPKLEDLKHGAEVHTSDGENVGKVHSIVLAPGENDVTHIGVNVGPHFPEPGFGDPEVKMVEVDHIKSATEDRVDLDITKDQLKKMTDFDHSHYFQVPREELDDTPTSEKTGGWLWNTAVAITRSLSTLGGLAVPVEHINSAKFERSILNDAPVWRTEPNTHIGNVESVLVDEATDDLAGLVIHRGVLFPVEVVLPMRYVTEIRDGVIHATISDEDLESLEHYEP
jgi:uncharacterized protein YrrD